MREIKFRAWDKEQKEYIQVYGAWFEEQGNFHETDLAQITDQYILEQYTGLKDKNGKEIYEGDIAKQVFVISYPGDSYQEGYEDEGYYIGEVRILPSTGVVLVRPRRISTYDDNESQLKYNKNVRTYRAEIIGNIHQNPELLE